MLTLTQAPLTWVILVDHKFQALGHCFQINTSGHNLIDDLKKEVKKERQIDLAAADLTIWKTKGTKIIDKTTLNRLAEILMGIKVDDKDTIEIASEMDELSDITLSKTQVLLVQPHADPLGVPITSNLDLTYKDTFLYAHTNGTFTVADIQVIDDNGKVPEFVQKHEKMLGRKQKVPDNMRASETNMGQASFNEYFDCSTEDSSGPFPLADRYHPFIRWVIIDCCFWEPSIVRFANTFLDTYKKERNFVFVAIFIGDIGLADRYVLYQNEGSQEVCCKKRTFRPGNTDDRVIFALELYNLLSVENLKASVNKLSKEHKLPMFTDKTKRPAGNDWGNRTGPNVRPKGDDGGANEQLEACGYEVVPDVLETDGGTWELISKLPPHILTVYRRSDLNKTELIAKHVREGSNELDILKYLHTIRPQSPHVISLIEAIPSNTDGGVRRRVELGWGLVKGLTYLHEQKVAHRDVNTDKIIDFDVAIEVQDENTKIDEYRGTKNWTAPEMGEEEGPTAMYSPIKADRWSCGRVLLRHGGRERRPAALEQRPSLLEWHKWFVPSSNDIKMAEKGPDLGKT
ncbi:hypothetical protein DFH94DRAFT_692479 [Russula ochroleuca]|uniref:Protein kinase domain-containing protein n=1 Tax=Russula ochroleuca TaxID=152965 RepID=A0A9P5T972_9AGAM|nr:hypothetical protein DFH94DRAFT_692479 [Russula ochroleuca]